MKIVNSGKASPEFIEFYNSLPKVIKAKKKYISEQEDIKDNQENAEDLADSDHHDNERSEWKDLYEEEIGKQIAKIQMLEKQLADMKKTSSIDNDTNDKVRSILKIDDVVALGVLQKSEAYDLIIKFCKNK